jgi:hypothetical protein
LQHFQMQQAYDQRLESLRLQEQQRSQIRGGTPARPFSGRPAAH